jgi:hypothetical protein
LAWMSPASTPLPVPVSPLSRTVGLGGGHHERLLVGQTHGLGHRRGEVLDLAQRALVAEVVQLGLDLLGLEEALQDVADLDLGQGVGKVVAGPGADHVHGLAQPVLGGQDDDLRGRAGLPQAEQLPAVVLALLAREGPSRAMSTSRSPVRTQAAAQIPPRPPPPPPGPRAPGPRPPPPRPARRTKPPAPAS